MLALGPQSKQSLLRLQWLKVVVLLYRAINTSVSSKSKCIQKSVCLETVVPSFETLAALMMFFLGGSFHIPTGPFLPRFELPVLHLIDGFSNLGFKAHVLSSTFMAHSTPKRKRPFQ